MNRRLIAAGAAYMCLLIGFSIFFLLNNDVNYLSYKKQIKAAQTRIDNQPVESSPIVITPEVTPSYGPVQSPPVNTGNTGSENQGKDSTPGGTGNGTKPGESQLPGNSSSTNDPVSQNNPGLEKDDYNNVNFTRNLRIGDKGEDVKKLQYLLKKKSYLKGNVDGIFGNITLEALKTFQKGHKLVVDGIAGQNTFKTLVE